MELVSVFMFCVSVTVLVIACTVYIKKVSSHIL